MDERVKESECLYHKLFPDLINGKLNTLDFLEASKGVVSLVEKFGMVFAPLSSDISGNIEKLEKGYERNPSECLFIEDLILLQSNELYTDALLWLKRALHFLLIFFQNIVESREKTESLQEHMTSAYSQTLEPHHGWLTRKLFLFFKRMVPDRFVLLSAIAEKKEFEEDVVVEGLRKYLEKLAVNVHHITTFYEEQNLMSEKKAP